MELHLVSGFLGSGKTTTIIALCKYLMQQGKKVAVVTNDQGRYLVDTAFIRASEIPALEVQSGCYCSNYQNLIEQLDELKKKVDPDIVFAEAIGSAGNLVGTVMKPLLSDSAYTPSSLTSLVDARLLLRLLRHEPLPFADSVSATFRSQINECDLLIINKLDIIRSEDAIEINPLFSHEFPEKSFHTFSAFDPEMIPDLYARIHAIKTPGLADSGLENALHQRSLERLKWSEKRYDLQSEGNVFDEIRHIIETLLARIKGTPRTIAHIKAFVDFEGENLKLGITLWEDDTWKRLLSENSAHSATLLINARIQSDESIDDLFI